MKTTINIKRKLQVSLIILFITVSHISFAWTATATDVINDGDCRAALNAVLPVQSLFLTATVETEKVKLSWTTAKEENLSHFIIEKSIDGVNYSQAALVFAFGNTNSKMEYSFSDNVNTIQTSVIYYRLRSVDNDMKSEFSEIRVIKVK